MAPCPEPFRIVPAQFFGLLRGKILLFMGVEVFFHLFYDMLRIAVILHVEIGRHFCHFVGMSAYRAELPFLEPVYIGKRPAPRAPEDKVHKQVVMRVSIIKIYGCMSTVRNFKRDMPAGYV
jgi:hypothetical protein